MKICFSRVSNLPYGGLGLSFSYAPVYKTFYVALVLGFSAYCFYVGKDEQD